jgi:hypothetical protein
MTTASQFRRCQARMQALSATQCERVQRQQFAMVFVYDTPRTPI